MSAAIIKLERFARSSELADPVILTQEMIDIAYQDGGTRGQEIQLRNDIADIKHAIKELCVSIEHERLDDKRRRREVIEAIYPILTSIMDAVGPIGFSSQLCTSLSKELSRMFESAPYKTCTIRCSPELSDLISDSIPLKDSKALRIELDSSIENLELSIDGGIIVFDRKIALGKISRLIEEIVTKE